MVLLGLSTPRVLALGSLLTVISVAKDSTSQLEAPTTWDFKLRAKRNCQMGECGPEEAFTLCFKCPMCCMEPATTTPPPPPPPQPVCCQPMMIPYPVPVPMPVPQPKPTPPPQIPQPQQCCYAPRPSPQCCQAPPAVPPKVILCCQMQPVPSNPCCQAAAALSQPQPTCVCAAPRPVPCRCSAPTPSSPPAPTLECAMASCPIYISKCPQAVAQQQPDACRRRRIRRDAFHSLLQQLSHNIPFNA